MAFVGVGGFATDIVAKEKVVAPLPLGMDFITGASFALAYGTADHALQVSGNRLARRHMLAQAQVGGGKGTKTDCMVPSGLVC